VFPVSLRVRAQSGIPVVGHGSSNSCRIAEVSDTAVTGELSDMSLL
jgi:hypothetical protein